MSDEQRVETAINIESGRKLMLHVRLHKILVIERNFTPKMGSSMNETPKGTSLGENTSYDV